MHYTVNQDYKNNMKYSWGGGVHILELKVANRKSWSDVEQFTFLWNCQ